MLKTHEHRSLSKLHQFLYLTNPRDGNAAVTGQAVTLPVTSKTESTFSHHATSITRQISLFPWTNSWRRHCQAETTMTTALCRQTNAAKHTKIDNNKPVFHHTLRELLNPQITAPVSLRFATQFEAPCSVNRIQKRT